MGPPSAWPRGWLEARAMKGRFEQFATSIRKALKVRAPRAKPKLETDDEVDWYERYTSSSIRFIRGAARGTEKCLAKGFIVQAARNHAEVARNYVELGTFYWRRGIDPTEQFEAAFVAYNEHLQLRSHPVFYDDGLNIPEVYAAFSLIGRKMKITVENVEYQSYHRWQNYQSCLIHLLHDQPLDDYRTGWLEKYLSKHNGLPEESFLIYFQLLGYLPTDVPVDDLVAHGEANWLKRKTSSFFSEGVGGHSPYIDMTVDIYLAAVLQKIGWAGDSPHRWRW
jgi:hypothetical protein